MERLLPQKLLLKHDKNTQVAVFATEKNDKKFSRMFRNFMRWNFQFMWRTFQVMPFNQVFPIHGLRINRKTPQIWAIADGKTAAH